MSDTANGTIYDEPPFEIRVSEVLGLLSRRERQVVSLEWPLRTPPYYISWYDPVIKRWSVGRWFDQAQTVDQAIGMAMERLREERAKLAARRAEWSRLQDFAKSVANVSGVGGNET